MHLCSWDLCSWCKEKKIWQKRFFLKLSSAFAKYLLEARIVTVLDEDAFDLEKLRNTINVKSFHNKLV